MKSRRWFDLAAAIPGVTVDDLERKFTTSRPIQLDLVDAPPLYQDLGAALARRLAQQDLDQGEMRVLLDMFCKDKR